MTTNSSFLSSRIANYKLSSSYPVITPLYSKELNYSGSFSFNSYTKSWSSYQNIALKTTDNTRSQEMTNNSDLQPLNWLQKESIIDIDPLDMEDDIKDESATPGYDDLVNPQITHAKVEVESQENSNIHDFVRFQAMRNSMNNSNRVALRNNNSFSDCNQNYSHHASGFAKPNLSYTQLIFMAIETCKDRAMTVNDIYQWCEVNYPYYKHIGPSWKNSLRHNLSINKSFRRMPRDGQTSVASYEVANSSDDMGDDSVSHRDHNNKQGGPGRGAYWVVDDKERKNLLDSIYRAHQTMPLSDRNGQRVDQPPYSFIVNPPKNGPMLRIDGRFTDASTYLQSKRSDDEIANENQISNCDSVNSELGPLHHPITDNCDAEYASMMYNLTVGGGSSSPDGCDNSIKLSASYNSTFSSRPAPQAATLSEEQSLTQQQETDECTAKSKNRRKSKHDKVRNYTDNDCPTGATAASAMGGSTTTNGAGQPHGNGMTSVNVVVAPHFDHIYARYQQFLPPAIASDMEKSVFSSQHTSAAAAGADNDNDCNPEGDFLRHGLRDDNDDDDDDEDNDSGADPSRPAGQVVVKLEAVDAEPPRLAMRMNGAGDRWASHHQQQSQRLKLNAVSVAFTRQRKVQRALSRRVRHSRRPSVRATTRSMKLKREMTEPARPLVNGASTPADENGAIDATVARGSRAQDAWNSDGYATDSTMPMIARQRPSTHSIRRGRRHRPAVSGAHARKSHQQQPTTAAGAAVAAATRVLPIKRKASTATNKANGSGGPPEKRYRSKRKRTRPLRIDESQEVAAIQFLASLEKRHQKLKNIENLYNFNAYLKSSLSTGDSSCNSSVVLVHE